MHTMNGDGSSSGPEAAPSNTEWIQEEALKARVFLRQATHNVELSWNRCPQSEKHLLGVSVSLVEASGISTSLWEGRYTGSFLQQLTARTGSPLAPRGLWDLLVGAVTAAQEDTKHAAGGIPGTEHAAAAGVFLNLWSAADLEALRRRGGADGNPEGAPPRSPDASKLFLIVTRAVEGKRVHYPLALTQRAAAPAVALAAATASPSLVAESPRTRCKEATVSAEAAMLEHQQHQTPRSHISVGGPQQLHVASVPQREQTEHLPHQQKCVASACTVASNGSVDANWLPRHSQRGLQGGFQHSSRVSDNFQQQRYGTPGCSLHPGAILGPPLADERTASAPGTPAAAAATGGVVHLGSDAAAELLRLRALVAEQQAALVEARRQNAACRQEMYAASLRGDSGDPQGLTAQLHRVEAELFMARQRLQTERQLRARETQRFRAEIDKIRRTEASLRTRVQPSPLETSNVRDLEAQLRSHNNRLKRSLVSSRVVSPALHSASSRCSSYDSHVADRQSAALRGRARASAPCARTMGPPLQTRSPSAGDKALQRAPTTFPDMSRSKLPSQGVRRGRSCSPYVTTGPRPSPVSGRPESGGPDGRTAGSLGVSASLLASTASSRARQRSNSIGSCCNSNACVSSSNSNHNLPLTPSCSCSRGRLVGSRNSRGTPIEAHAHRQLPWPPQADWRLPPPSSWTPLKQTTSAAPLLVEIGCRYRNGVRSPARCSGYSPRVPKSSAGGEPPSYGSRNSISNTLVLNSVPRGSMGGPWPVAACSMRDRSPFAAEARCEEDALLPSTATGSQQQHQQPPFVVLSAVEYERMRQRGCAEQRQGSKASEGIQEPQPLISTYGENLMLPGLMPRPQNQPGSNSDSVEVRNKVDVESSSASLREGNSALTTASASDGISAETVHVADEPSLSTPFRMPDTKSVAQALPSSSTVIASRPLVNTAKPTDYGGAKCPQMPETIGTPKELKAGRAVFSEIDERLTALQKFLRSTRESFRLMETGTLGA